MDSLVVQQINQNGYKYFSLCVEVFKTFRKKYVCHFDCISRTSLQCNKFIPCPNSSQLSGSLLAQDAILTSIQCFERIMDGRMDVKTMSCVYLSNLNKIERKIFSTSQNCIIILTLNLYVHCTTFENIITHTILKI